jgi:uncharacterized protein (DUF427 family)/outer membrane lipoprotein-sorting protein/thiol-disulfide isomerase/thioredoxin
VSVLARSAAALKAANALSADFVTSTTYAAPYRDTEERGTITIARPGSVRVDLTRHRRIRAGQDWEPTGNGALIVADGRQVWSLTRHPASSQIRTDAQRPDSLVSALRGIDPLLPFFTPQAATKARYIGKQTVDGTPVEVVETSDASTGERRCYFVREDGFPIKTITTTAAKTGGSVTREVRLTNLRRNPTLAPGVFAFTPPTDAIPWRERLPGRRQPRSHQPLRSDSPRRISPCRMPPEKPVRLSDYKGKTVLLKFWATWCWPCRQSLPETQDLAKSGEKDGVTVLAVALWDSPAAFGKWTAANAAKYPSLQFAFDPKPQGRDTGSALYGVSVTPTEYVIGPDGTIRAVFQGTTARRPRGGGGQAGLFPGACCRLAIKAARKQGAKRYADSGKEVLYNETPQAVSPGPGQESVWDYPRPPRLEDSPKRLKIVFNGENVAETSRSKRVLETSHPPVYYIPSEDVRSEFLVPASGTSFCEWKGAGAVLYGACRGSGSAKCRPGTMRTRPGFRRNQRVSGVQSQPHGRLLCRR